MVFDPEVEHQSNQKLKKAGFLHLLDAIVIATDEEKERRLRNELRIFLAENDGIRPGSTSSLFIRN